MYRCGVKVVKGLSGLNTCQIRIFWFRARGCLIGQYHTYVTQHSHVLPTFILFSHTNTRFGVAICHDLDTFILSQFENIEDGLKVWECSFDTVFSEAPILTSSGDKTQVGLFVVLEEGITLLNLDCCKSVDWMWKSQERSAPSICNERAVNSKPRQVWSSPVRSLPAIIYLLCIIILSCNKYRHKTAIATFHSLIAKHDWVAR